MSTTESNDVKLECPDTAKDKSFTAIDFWVCLLLVALGALQFFLYQRSPDFPHEDVGYFEFAKSLLHSGFYGFNSVPEKVQPPGLPILVALLCATIGCGHSVLLRVMAVILTMGLLASYVLIRREAGRGVAAGTCLLLGSSPALFVLGTQYVFPSMPYLLTSVLALLAALKLEAAKTRRSRFSWQAGLSLLVIISEMIQSAGFALLGGISAWIAASFFFDRQAGRSRLKLFLPVLVLGLAVEGTWLLRGSNPSDWPLGGYPGSYVSQVKLKSGNNPELGPASLRDVASRVDKNARERTSLLIELLSRRWVNPSISSAGMAIPLVLILLGVASSIWARGGQIYDWYFLCYECIYLLWPWSYEALRFFLPVTPLACLYLFRGSVALARWSREYTRRVGIGCFPIAVVNAVHAAIFGWRSDLSSGLQWKVSAVLWVLLAVCSVRMIWKGPLNFAREDFQLWRFLGEKMHVGGVTIGVGRAAGIVAAAFLFMVGVNGQIRIGRDNLAYNEDRLERVPDILAARWIRGHTDSNAVIAARHIPLVYHYAQRRVIWFPPITNAKVLMEGIQKHKVRYLIIIDRDFSYYMPSDETCFEKLEAAYPNSFRLVERNGEARVYEILSTASPMGSGDRPAS